MNTNTVEDWFRANYLDGDEVQDGQMLSSKECLDALTTLTQHHQAELAEVYQEINEDIFSKRLNGWSGDLRGLQADIKALALTRGIDISDNK